MFKLHVKGNLASDDPFNILREESNVIFCMNKVLKFYITKKCAFHYSHVFNMKNSNKNVQKVEVVFNSGNWFMKIAMLAKLHCWLFWGKCSVMRVTTVMAIHKLILTFFETLIDWLITWDIHFIKFFRFFWPFLFLISASGSKQGHCFCERGQDWDVGQLWSCILAYEVLYWTHERLQKCGTRVYQQ